MKGPSDSSRGDAAVSDRGPALPVRSEQSTELVQS